MAEMDSSGVIHTGQAPWDSVKVAKHYLDKEWPELSEREQLLCLEMSRLQRLEMRTQEFFRQVGRQ